MRLRTNPDVRGPGRRILIRDWVKGVVNRSDRPTDRWMTEPRCWTNAPAAAPLKRTGYDRWSRGIHIGQCEPAQRTERRKRTETVTTGKWVKRPTSKETDRWGHNVHRTLRDLTYGEVFTTGRPLTGNSSTSECDIRRWRNPWKTRNCYSQKFREI